jgi:hypothetical protein
MPFQTYCRLYSLVISRAHVKLSIIFFRALRALEQIIDNLTCTRGYFGRLFPEKNLEYVPLQALSNRYFNDS